MATCREMLMANDKVKKEDKEHILLNACPHTYGYLPPPDWCPFESDDPDIIPHCSKNNADDCWDREIDEHPKILDSGERRQFETGAVRDIQEGKGRCDLMPLDVVSELLRTGINKFDPVLDDIYRYQDDGDVKWLYAAIMRFGIFSSAFKDLNTACLEVSKHFEEGAKKYGENNWQKGIPTHCYIDSAVRHYLKFCRGDKDEPHDRAFVWNLMCCIWTCKHKPELNDYAKEGNADVDKKEQ